MSWQRWQPVNAAKNAPVTVQIHCTMTGTRQPVPSKADEDANYFDESPADVLYGYTTLHDLIKKVKKDLPALYLSDQIGGSVLTCGRQHVPKSEWDTTMLWELICEDKAGSDVPRVKLEDGREAVVVTIGTEQKFVKPKPTQIHRILAKGNRTPSMDLTPIAEKPGAM